MSLWELKETLIYVVHYPTVTKCDACIWIRNTFLQQTEGKKRFVKLQHVVHAIKCSLLPPVVLSLRSGTW